MRVIKTVISILLLASILGCGAVDKTAVSEKTNATPPPKETNFREASWGDTKEEVKKGETDSLKTESKDELVYIGKLYDLESEIRYKFKDEKLIQGTYWIKANRDVTKPDGLISDYDNLKNKLTNKYGSPNQDKEEWKINPTDSEKSRGTYKTVGIQMGVLSLKTVWVNGNTEILLNLNNPTNDKQNYTYYHFFIQYSQETEGKI